MDPNHITITIDKSVKDFKHKLKEIRDIFANHPEKEPFFKESHGPMLVNYHQLVNLGPHPILATQTTPREPKRWIHIKIKVKDKEDWIDLHLRDDNVYVYGFTNHHDSYELLPANQATQLGEDKKEMLPKGLLPNYFVKLHWSLTYIALLECMTNSEVEAALEKILEEPHFIVDAVSFLSNYKHKVGHQEVQRKAKRYLAGMIFILCEPLRIDIDLEMTGTFRDEYGGYLCHKKVTRLQKAQLWGEICEELLKWRYRNFQKWITTDIDRDGKWPRQFEQCGIDMEVCALQLVSLVLNRRDIYFDNMEKIKPKPTRGKPKGRGDDGDDGEWSGSHDKWGEDDGKGDSQDKRAKDGWAHYGCCRVQILAISANFDIDGINIYDWYGGQPIYRRHFVVNEPSSLFHDLEQLALVGPNRAIIPYGSPVLEIFRSKDLLEDKRKITTPMERVWNVLSYDDYDEATLFNSEIVGELPYEKISITYMLIPNAVEATIEVSLMLGDYNDGELCSNLRGGGYHVSGFIKVYNNEMKDKHVELFSAKYKSFWVPCGKMTQIPVVSHVCLPGKDVEVYVSLNLKPLKQLLGQEEEELGPYFLKFNPTLQTQQRQFNNHQIEIKVNMINIFFSGSEGELVGGSQAEGELVGGLEEPQEVKV